MGAYGKVIGRPEVRSIGSYDFPSKSAQALYGEDQLVHVWWDGNPWFAAAACWRAPKAMSFGDFWTAMVVPFFEEDPDWQASWTTQDFAWGLDGEDWAPEDGQGLAALGVGHKSVIRMVKK